MEKRESKIERAFTKYAKSKGCLSLKFESRGFVGVPDRLVIGPNGLHFYIEFKSFGKHPSITQRRVHARLRALGHKVFCFNKPGQAEACLDLLLAKLPVVGKTSKYGVDNIYSSLDETEE